MPDVASVTAQDLAAHIRASVADIAAERMRRIGSEHACRVLGAIAAVERVCAVRARA